LNEAHTVTYFPHSASGKIKYLLQEYLGLDRKMIARFKRANSRWCTIYKNYPQVYMVEREIGLLNIMDETKANNINKLVYLKIENGLNKIINPKP
jgi:hypothetical protein